jgi:hypothetical protein
MCALRLLLIMCSEREIELARDGARYSGVKRRRERERGGDVRAHSSSYCSSVCVKRDLL